MAGRTFRLVIVTAVFAAFGTTMVPIMAAADTLADDQTSAQQLEGRIEANARKLDALNEELNQAQIELDAANAAIRDSDAKVAATEAKRKHLRAVVARRAASTYRHSFELDGIAGLGARTVLDFATRERYAA